MKRLERNSQEFVMEGMWLWKLLSYLHLLSKEDYNTIKGLM